jgi:hypothetical protein
MSSAVNLSIGFAQAQNQAPIQASKFFSAHGKGMATERIKSDGLNYPRRLTCHAFRARARFPLRKPMRSITRISSPAGAVARQCVRADYLRRAIRE